MTGPGTREREIAGILLDQQRIQTRVVALAQRISADYRDRDPLLVGVLKGALIFMADLCRALTINHQMDFVAAASYGSATQTSGVIRLRKDLDQGISGRHVLVVEDIIDTGLTPRLPAQPPAGPAAGLAGGVRAALQASRAPGRRRRGVQGFDIPSVFVVGYGLDYAERYRNLPFVATLRQEVYEPSGAR
jgi:hypoxanthine phosphoribosyltransferase